MLSSSRSSQAVVAAVVVVVEFVGLESMPGNYDAFWTEVPGSGR